MNKDSKHYEAGRSFEAGMNSSERKDKGVFYTPLEIVDYMAREALAELDLLENPYIKLLDPACGAGYFLIKSIELLEIRFLECLSKLLEKKPEIKEHLEKNNIRRYIAENIVWGVDIDPAAVELAKASIIEFVGMPCKPNVYCCDSLTEHESSGSMLWRQKYDFILGNPPYIGHKGVDSSYKLLLQALYKGIYKDKSDILFCFIKRAIDQLKPGGVLSFICSRYLIEGPSADGLREYITDNCGVTEIVDFCGCNVFQDAGIASAIFTFRKADKAESLNIKGLKIKSLRVRRFRNSSAVSKNTSIMNEDNFHSYSISKSRLAKSGWLLMDNEEYEIYDKIQSQGTHFLAELFDSHQGIITGCDKAFILDAAAIEAHNIERELIKPWIKNSNVKKHKVIEASQFIVYADMIDNEEAYPNSISYISKYKERLMQRRECLKGTREWYKLQWGRRAEEFESKKIIYPYKSKENRFAVDVGGNYCSADVYSLRLKKEYEGRLSYEHIAAILNSKPLEFYFKSFAKRINGNQYDYYPNTVLRIRISVDTVNPKLQELSAKIGFCNNEADRDGILSDINRVIYDIYGLSEKQIMIIENYI